MSDPGAGDGDAAESGGSDGGATDTNHPPSDRNPDGSRSSEEPSADGRTRPQPNAGEPNPRGLGGPGDPPEAGVSASRGGSEPKPETLGEWVKWFFRTDHGAVVYIREIVSSVALVLLVGLLLFAISGLWPPMVAVESGSMNPHMQRGDLVFVMEENRLAPPAAYEDTGVVTYQTGERTGYRKFQLPGDVIVYNPDGRTTVTPIIHRARFWVNESENWVANGKAQPEHLGAAESCGQLSQCPAPHAGFITKGDANGRYDQVSGLSDPVKPAWVVGTAEFRIPWLGNIRLWASQTTLEPGAMSPRGVEARAGPGAGATGTVGQCAWG